VSLQATAWLNVALYIFPVLHRHASQEREARASPFSALNIRHPQLDPIRSPNGTQRLSSEYVDANQRNVSRCAEANFYGCCSACTGSLPMRPAMIEVHVLQIIA